MTEKKFRFKDLETDRRSTPSPEEIESLEIKPIRKNREDELENLICRTSKNPRPNTLKSMDSHLEVMNALKNIEMLIRKMNGEKPDDDNENVRYIGDDYIAYPDPENENIEFYLINKVVVMHNIQLDIYVIGNTMYEDMTFNDIVDMLYNDPDCDVSIFDDDIGYIVRFFDVYATAICNMITTLGTVIKSYDGDSTHLNIIDDAIENACNIIDDIDDDSVETDECTDDIDDDIDDTDEYVCEDESSVVDIIKKHINDTNNSTSDSIEDLPTMEEAEFEQPHNLKDYAEAIDNKIPDDEAAEIIKNARSARRDRSIQLHYTAPQK